MCGQLQTHWLHPPFNANNSKRLQVEDKHRTAKEGRQAGTAPMQQPTSNPGEQADGGPSRRACTVPYRTAGLWYCSPQAVTDQTTNPTSSHTRGPPLCFFPSQPCTACRALARFHRLMSDAVSVDVKCNGDDGWQCMCTSAPAYAYACVGALSSNRLRLLFQPQQALGRPARPIRLAQVSLQPLGDGTSAALN